MFFGNKGMSEFISVIIIVAITVGVGIIASLFLSGFLTTQTQTAETRGTALTGCGGVTISVDKVDVTNKYLIVSNPSSNVIYTISTVDSSGVTNTTAATVQKRITAGSLQILNFSGSSPGFPSTGSIEVIVRGFCEFSGSNVSIEGVCKNSGACWTT